MTDLTNMIPCIIKGKSLEPYLKAGEVAYLSKELRLNKNDLAIIKRKDGLICKRVRTTAKPEGFIGKVSYILRKV